MYVLGLSCHFHDSAAALLCEGELVAAAAEERFTRVKHDSRFPDNATAFCLKHAGISSQELDYVVFYEKPFLKLDRILTTCLATFPRSAKLFRESAISWLSDKLWIKALIAERLDIPPARILFCPHHASHAASAFFASGFERAAILTVDGVGEWATATRSIGDGVCLAASDELRWPHSVGLLYSTFTAFLGFEVNEGEYKVMGLAPYGRPRFVDQVHKLVRVHENGAVELDLDYFEFHRSPERMFNERFVSLFGSPRPPDQPLLFAQDDANARSSPGSDQHYADVAASVQFVTEEILLAMTRSIVRDTGIGDLCLAGGVALNSVANGRILRESGVDRLFVQPSAGDGGGALGAALYVWHHVLGKPRDFSMEHVYWGRRYTEAEVEGALREHAARVERLDEPALLDRAVDALTQGEVIGWYQGRFEWGPRALGNRSILADPRRQDMKDTVNARIKFREPFRPFAPSLPRSAAKSWFSGRVVDQSPARFMLAVGQVHEDKRREIPAVVHVDGSARPHIVDRDLNPRYDSLMQRFAQATGTPVLLNTSFNLRGEPIVASPSDALSTFFKSGLDALFFEHCVVRKQAGP